MAALRLIIEMSAVRVDVARPCAARPHARMGRGMGRRVRRADVVPLIANDS
ncbi:hypothetical protein I551_3051 [Mycobacterium ulcerans str. Harvey]|uniref:Uncharacterized protein n=1 Tax=Mycobacterium ulcerans str. Harvey TaxID=1299332 RepID=A0ABP3AGT0_MYCUL|nr:hypothetical protein I551_3051 [Mycobacterium ulcerans str. Harvey]MBC9860500.1 hypothetical protein [Mycobacterium pseudoshottsii]